MLSYILPDTEKSELMDAVKDDGLDRLLLNGCITPYFQPIIDLYSGSPLGYEILTRGCSPLESATKIFNKAKEERRLWEIECECRRAAFSVISRLPAEERGLKYFLNVSPELMSDPGFTHGFTIQALEREGLDPNHFIIEISESHRSFDYGTLEDFVRHYSNQGFTIALDNFGAGHSSFSTIISVNPHFIKLDRMVTENMHENAYKQLLVKSMVSFASSVEGAIVAEGVETWEELECAVRLGVRYAQGYLFSHPTPQPEKLKAEVHERLMQVIRKYNYPRIDLDETINNLVVMPKAIDAGTLLCESVDLLFKRNRSIDHIVILDERKPVGIITRQHFYVSTSGPFGYPLLQKKPAEVAAKSNPLVVPNKMGLTTLSRLAMERMPEDLYDPVVVVDEEGKLIGSVTIKQLISRAGELEVKNAMGANPLTNLPGNRSIHKWIDRAIESPPFTVIYGDLDKFKEFNDAYGFLMGDELIKLASSILSARLEEISPRANLGHVGGDDFIIVVNDLVAEDGLRKICEDFDRERLKLLRPDDAERGWYMSTDRAGNKVEVPLPMISLAVVDSNNLDIEPHPALLGQISASLKKKIKEINSRTRYSGYLKERRVYTSL
ncbi:MAG: EAL and GGDEF domain-containing protein [Planctomycetes bacterium]|nr:EAL and GGDEF domain-containing protein [Planctomycetota bacterium]